MLRGKARVTGPSREVYEEHMRTHVPFRSWCEFCVKGKSKAGLHKKKGENIRDLIQTEVPTIAVDYTFPRQKEENRAEQGGMPILVMKNNIDKCCLLYTSPSPRD